MPFIHYTLPVSLLAICITGCAPKPVVPVDEPVAKVELHAHASEGPHQGSLVELGNDEFHAEVVHAFKSVTIYVLDAAASNAVPIDATELTINLMHDGTPEQYKLAASPETTDPKGKSSRFTLENGELASRIDNEASAPKLMITINGTPYRGEIKHRGHDGHDH